MRILIADDDAATSKLLTVTLTKWGYDVVATENGADAWELIQRAPQPSLLILDWAMPKMDGITLCQRIRDELGPNYHPYIILLTQASGAENIVKGLTAGANEFLVKPFNLAELQSRIIVGDKIIQYEKTLENQNTQLKKYISQIEAANAIALKASTKLSDVIKTQSASETEPTTPHFENLNLEEARSDFSEIIDVFKDFDPTKAEPIKHPPKK